MKISLSPCWLVPLALVSPYLFIGDYGITIVELVLVMTFFALALPAMVAGSLRLPGFLLAYMVMFTAGWLGGVANGLFWGMPVGPWNLSFFYKVVLMVGGFYVGYYCYRDMDAVITGRSFRIVLLVLGLCAAVYPFISYEYRYALLRVFFAGESDLARLYSPRFPGLGVNANIYSFMVFIFVVFTFDAYVRRRMSAIYALLGFVVVFTAASKLVISLSVGACLIVLMRRLLKVSNRSDGTVALLASRRAMGVTLMVMLFFSAVIVYVTQTETGAQIIHAVETVDRFVEALDNRAGASSFGSRFELWHLGMERVDLAPLLGIVKHRYLESDGVPLLFAYPHNEFIAQWMFYGVLGMAAHVFLLAWLLAMNMRHGATLAWPLVYTGLLLQMMFDGAFEYVRFYALIFLLVGMNVRYLQLKKRDWIVVEHQQEARMGTIAS